MLSAFPYLFNYWTYVPTFLRIIAGVYFFTFGYKGFRNEQREKIEIFDMVGLRPAKYFAISVSLVEVIGGCLLFLGLFVQVVVVTFSVISITAIVIKIHEQGGLKRNVDTYILLLVILLSLLFLGPGRLAIDLPL